MPNFELDCGCFYSCECDHPEPGSFAHSGTPGYVIQEARLRAAAASPVAMASLSTVDANLAYEAVLSRAQRKDPRNSFVASCREFLKERGFLSARQVAALERVRPTVTRGVITNDDYLAESLLDDIAQDSWDNEEYFF
jgi:hypothetical protein